MKKSYIITAAVVLLAVLLTGFALIKTGKINIGDKPTDPTEPEIVLDTESYLSAVAATTAEANLPMLESGLSKVYFTINLDNDVTFWKLSGNAFTKLEESGTYKITLDIAYQSIPVTVHYYTNKDGKTVGFGVFKPSDDESVYLYDYAFFKLLDTPDALAKTDRMLLLADTTKEDFHKNGKIYEEPYYYDTENGDLTRILSGDNRSIDDRGAPRADYSMVDESLFSNYKDNLLFFSARHYQLLQNEGKMDILRSGGSGNNTDNVRVVTDVADYYAVNTKSGIRFIGRTENGFAVKVLKGDEETVEKEFTGNFKEDYLRSGNFILNRQTLEYYNISTKEEGKINLTKSYAFEPDTFAVNKNGTFFMRGVSADTAAIAIGTLAGGGTVHHNDLFRFVLDPVITSDTTVMFSVAGDEAGTNFTNYFMTVS